MWMSYTCNVVWYACIELECAEHVTDDYTLYTECEHMHGTNIIYTMATQVFSASLGHAQACPSYADIVCTSCNHFYRTIYMKLRT